jgi:hypothetical protein
MKNLSNLGLLLGYLLADDKSEKQKEKLMGYPRSKEMEKLVYEATEKINELKAKAAELDRLKLAIKDAMILYPYKVHGEGCTYESYNQGWQDALGYVESEVE